MRHLAFLTLLSSLAPAQSVVAYPQDSTTTTSGNLVAMGYLAAPSPTNTESRFQLLIPARYLPSTGGSISSVSLFSVTTSVTLQYPRLRLTLSPTTLPALSNTFATNLSNPVRVLDATNGVVAWTAGQWVSIPFTTPFIYDGTSNLVLDIQKVVAPLQGIQSVSHGISSNPGRLDLPVTRFAFGGPGSGAWNDSRSNGSGAVPLKVRLEFDVPTLTLRSDRALQQNVFGLGSAMETTFYGSPGQAYAVLAEGGFATTPFPVPPVQGLSWLPLQGALTLRIGAVPAPGPATFSVTLPTAQGLVGAQFALQGLYVGGGGPTWTNACDFRINQ